MTKMMNGFISCQAVDEVVQDVGGFMVPTKDLNYKRLIINSFDSQDVSPKLNKGDEVYVMKNSGVEVPMGDDKFIIIKEIDILFINK